MSSRNRPSTVPVSICGASSVSRVSRASAARSGSGGVVCSSAYFSIGSGTTSTGLTVTWRSVSGAEPVLTQRELNRALLARQMLLERAKAPLPRAVERMGGVQAQYAPSSYIALWSRVDGFQREALTRALERRSLVQATVLRGTIHIVSRRDFWPWRAAVRAGDERWLRRVRPWATPRRTTAANLKLRRALADGPRRAEDLIAAVGKDAWLAADVDLVRVPPSGTWGRRRADLYALAEDWVGPDDADEETGRELLVRRYLAAFGPATVADIRSWSRLDREETDRALERIE